MSEKCYTYVFTHQLEQWGMHALCTIQTTQVCVGWFGVWTSKNGAASVSTHRHHFRASAPAVTYVQHLGPLSCATKASHQCALCNTSEYSPLTARWIVRIGVTGPIALSGVLLCKLICHHPAGFKGQKPQDTARVHHMLMSTSCSPRLEERNFPLCGALVSKFRRSGCTV